MRNTRHLHLPLHTKFRQPLPRLAPPTNRLADVLTDSSPLIKNATVPLVRHWPRKDVKELKLEGRCLGRWAKANGSGRMDTRPGVVTHEVVKSQLEAAVSLSSEEDFQRTINMLFMDLQRACGKPGEVRISVYRVHVNIDRH